MHLSDELFQHSLKVYFGVYFPSCEATREINSKITLELAQKQFVTRVHTLFYFLHESINDDKDDDLYTQPVSHSLGFLSAGDVTIDC